MGWSFSILIFTFLIIKYLGIDFGLSHLGFAVSNGEIAEPLKVFVGAAPRGRPLSKTIQIIQIYKIEQIIIGITDGKIGELAKAFGEKLKKETGLPVHYQNEDMTSLRAAAQMVQSGKRKSLRQKMDHAVAAANILQDYLDTNSTLEVDSEAKYDIIGCKDIQPL